MPGVDVSSSSSPIELGREQRRHRRHRVHLEVRFGSARDYVVEYAQNLSRGGLFIRGIFDDVKPLQLLELCVELPGFNRFEVTGRVVHVRRPANAIAQNSVPGLGIELVESPPKFDAALRHYLERLGHRRDFAVLSTDPAVRDVLEAAGYRALQSPPPGEIASFCECLPQKVLALALGRRERDEYTADHDFDGPIIEIDFLAEIDEILRVLDGLMVKAIGAYEAGAIQVAR